MRVFVPIPALLLCGICLGGCATYRAAPFGAAKHQAQWTARAKQAEAQLALADAVRLALLFNPNLRQARAQLQVAAAGKAHAGLLGDPSANLGLGRTVTGAASPWLIEGGLSVTVPLSDRLQVEKQTSARLFNMQEAQVLAEEAKVVLEVRQAFARFAGAKTQAQAWQAQARQLRLLQEKVGALVAAGSVAAFEADALALAQALASAKLAGAEAQVQGERLQVLALCGLRPECPLELAQAGDAGGDARARAKDAPAFIHPLRLAAQAAFDAAESALQLEIARSRPEFSFGPTGKREDGETTLGLGLGLTLPIWNRNQLAIAQASARREVARVALEQTIEGLAHGQAQAQVKAAAGSAEWDFLQKETAPVLKHQAESIDKLTALGQFDPLRLLAVLEQRTQCALALAEAQMNAAQAVAELAYFTQPVPPSIPQNAPSARAEVLP